MYATLKPGSRSSTSSESLDLSDYHDEQLIKDEERDRNEEGACYIDRPLRTRRSAASFVRWQSLCLHLLLASLYGAVFLLAMSKTRPSTRWEEVPRKHLIESPLHEAIQMERKTIYASIESENPFKGAPSEELDHAWHQLFINSNIRVTAEDLARINRTSVPIHDEKGGFYAIPGTYKFLRQVVYQNYYHIGKPTTPVHIEHCIDNLRQNIMCKADVALLTFTWDPNDRAPKPNFVVEHECANWEMMDNWAEEHAFDIFDETTLVHPTLGPSFPEKEYKATGRVPGHPDFHPNEYHGDAGQHHREG
ncbi:oxidase ustYa family protein [Aspergillus saccharolyticus JOP 1030-1]|uniref:Tat pathway signal sequence n=1 Tax=Aspergillus saccharolyticus JOP 1030-1 TaxID=1450539 RepID=A0A318ZVP3_9EURO|nr:hypothetical protein BP01DRAFT_299177 [Aspergillus saccharolyticus JOP 1030-1]PYH44198.1 hypothetical protein BP01DRAFT_299177 [Aspergillus saccharolyticus JOP 1030-1]